ncbi:hypothetical protein V1502_09535 [Bacillus sp. SCS-153A]|uniref:hypothetical protein n=1 Tax=Rossellomorea sedimentorum TaxID=3115294 RepID=UPI00390695CC
MYYLLLLFLAAIGAGLALLYVLSTGAAAFLGYGLVKLLIIFAVIVIIIFALIIIFLAFKALLYRKRC